MTDLCIGCSGGFKVKNGGYERHSLSCKLRGTEAVVLNGLHLFKDKLPLVQSLPSKCFLCDKCYGLLVRIWKRRSELQQIELEFIERSSNLKLVDESRYVKLCILQYEKKMLRVDYYMQCVK